MKWKSFLITIAAHGIGLFVLQLLGKEAVVLGLIVCTLVLGLLLRFSSGLTLNEKKVGWGLLYGSLASLISFFAYLDWLYNGAGW